ncbi:MAG: DUF465 domain-containing protein [Rickettsiales bacterium]
MVNSLKHQKELDHLRSLHKQVEGSIEQELQNKIINQFKIHDLKKQKLKLKESINQLESLLVGDIVA